jgi:hypothetical protein
MGRPAVLALALAAALAGCGQSSPKLADACTEAPDRVVAALRHAPAGVTLDGDTRLSDCVARAMDTADLQDVGAVMTATGARLAAGAPRSRLAALRLGYLIGAVERGSAETAGIQEELANRMRGFLDDRRLELPARAAVARGRAAGRARG